MNKYVIIACLLFCARVQAGWELRSSERVGSPTGALHIKKTIVGNDRQVVLHLIILNTDKFGLEVVDHPQDDGSDLAAVLSGIPGCVAGVNGNYFQPDRESLGLVISDGRLIHPFQRARLLSGILVVTADRAMLLRSEEYRKSGRIRQALQAGPFLIDKGLPVAGLESTAEAVRTAVLWDGRAQVALLVTAPLTLEETSRVLSTPGVITEFKIQRALNLDGGGSTGLWVKNGSNPFYLPELKSVRNYLAVIAKP